MMIVKGIGLTLLGIGLFLLATYVVMRLWNGLVPSLFNGPRLRFVQALGLFFLARLLFGFGFGRSSHYSYGRPYWHHSGHHRDGIHCDGLHRDDLHRDDQHPYNRLKPVIPAPDQE